MRVPAPHPAIAAAAIAIAACSAPPDTSRGDAPLIRDPIVPTFNNSAEILEGYNTLTDVMRQRCVEHEKTAECAANAPKTVSKDFRDLFKLEMVSSRKELSDKLAVSANISARYKVIEANAQMGFEKESKFTSNSITFLLRGETTYWTFLNSADYAPKLTEAARKLLDEETKPEVPTQFFVQCGNAYVRGVQKGAQFFLLMTITTDSHESRETLQAKLSGSANIRLGEVKAEIGAEMAKAMKEHNAKVTLSIQTNGFFYGGAPATNALLSNALGGEISRDMFEKLVGVHDAMLKSVNDDLCLARGLGYTQAKLEGATWTCVREGAPAVTGTTLVRLNLADYATARNLPAFTPAWSPLVTFERKLDQARKYIGILSRLEAAIATTYYDEIAPYRPANDAVRARHGLAPPVIRPVNEPFMKLADQDAAATYWAGRFMPPDGAAFDRAHSAAENCFRGVARADFGKCTCGQDPDPTDRCLAALDQYRLSWRELFEYRETGRILPLAAYSPKVPKTHAEGIAFCAARPGATMISYDQARRSAIAVAGSDFGQRGHSVWFQGALAPAFPRCPLPEWTPEEKGIWVAPYFRNAPANVAGGQDQWRCGTSTGTTGVLCVPSGGLFAMDIYADRLTGLPVPPPEVVWSQPAAGAVGVYPDTPIKLVLSAALDPASVSTSTVRLLQGTGTVEADVTYAAIPLGGGTLTIQPAARLAAGKQYTVEVTTGVKGVDGDPLLRAFTLRFTVINHVESFTPAHGTTGAPLEPKVKVTFAAPVVAASVTGDTVQLWHGNQRVAATVSYDASTRTATLSPTAALAGSTQYTASVTNVRSEGGQGNPVYSMGWSFTTGTAVIDVSPAPDETGVARRVTPFVRYSELLGEIPAGALTIKKGATAVPATADTLFRHALLFPEEPLEANTRYTVTITKAVTDRHGKPVVSERSWSFTTGAELDP